MRWYLGWCPQDWVAYCFLLIFWFPGSQVSPWILARWVGSHLICTTAQASSWAMLFSGKTGQPWTLCGHGVATGTLGRDSKQYMALRGSLRARARFEQQEVRLWNGRPCPPFLTLHRPIGWRKQVQGLPLLHDRTRGSCKLSIENRTTLERTLLVFFVWPKVHQKTWK